MAGIGFGLKKLFDKRGYLNKIKAYLYTALVTVGPTILCMSLVIALQFFLIELGVGNMERELLLAAVTYTFIFSLILTSGFTMITTRYVSDRLYLKKYEDIVPSCFGVTAICMVLGGIIAGIFFYNSHLDFWFKILAYIVFMEMIAIWIISVYLTAIKDYVGIAIAFLIGIGITIGIAYIAIRYTDYSSVNSFLAALTIGNLFIALNLNIQIRRFFRKSSNTYFKFLSYFDKFTALFFASLFYTVGIYVHNFVFWFSSSRVVAGGTYIFCPLYDVPSFYAFLTILSAMVIFIATVETSFYEKYKNYYMAVIGQGSLEDIERSKKELNKVLIQEITYVMELQLFFTLILIVVGMWVLPKLGFTGLKLDVFNILALGSYACIIMFIQMLILLYFDDRKGALFVSMTFLVLNTAFSILSLKLGENYYGIGYFLASIISLVVAIMRLSYYVKNLNYYTFCSQPVISRERKGVFTSIVKKIYGDIDLE